MLNIPCNIIILLPFTIILYESELILFKDLYDRNASQCALYTIELMCIRCQPIFITL